MYVGYMYAKYILFHNFRLCDRHFDRNQFMNQKCRGGRLMPNALPHIFDDIIFEVLKFQDF